MLSQRPLKWKFFLWANVFLLTFSLFGIVMITYHLAPGLAKMGFMEFVIIVLCILGFAAVTINSCTNILMLNKYFPDQQLPKKIDRLSLILFYINIIYWFLFALALAFTFADFGKYEDNFTTGALISITFSTITILLQIFVLVMQIKMPNIIDRNHQLKMKQMIETIGSEQN